MYHIKKTFSFDSCHCLVLDYPSKCVNKHGHTWEVTVHCKTEKLNHNGMVLDFTEFNKIKEFLDHKTLNDIFPFNPTAENLAEWIGQQVNEVLWKQFSAEGVPVVNGCVQVDVQETAGNVATWTLD